MTQTPTPDGSTRDPWADFLSDECVCVRAHNEGMPSFGRSKACRWKGHVHANNTPRPSEETLRKLGYL